MLRGKWVARMFSLFDVEAGAVFWDDEVAKSGA